MMTEHRELMPVGDYAMIPWGHPSWLPGIPCRKGYLRGRKTTLLARNDVEAVAAWIDAKGSGSLSTADNYRREAERLLFWCASLNVSLSELTEEHLVGFHRFLQKPKPERHWLCKKGTRRSSPNWRPFTEPLSEASAGRSMKLIGSLFSYLARKGWIDINPMPDIKQPTSVPRGPRTKTLSVDQIEAVSHGVRALSNDPEGARSRWAFNLLYHSGLRCDEAVHLKMSNFRRTLIRDGGQETWGWELEIVGKGKKTGWIPVCSDLLDELALFRTSIGLPPHPGESETYPAVPSTKAMHSARAGDGTNVSGISRSTMYRMIKSLFFVGGKHLREVGKLEDARHLEKASPHWLRHTLLKDAYDSTLDILVVKQLGRHSNVNTSAGYAPSTETEVRAAIEKRRCR